MHSDTAFTMTHTSGIRHTDGFSDEKKLPCLPFSFPRRTYLQRTELDTQSNCIFTHRILFQKHGTVNLWMDHALVLGSKARAWMWELSIPLLYYTPQVAINTQTTPIAACNHFLNPQYSQIYKPQILRLFINDHTGNMELQYSIERVLVKWEIHNSAGFIQPSHGRWFLTAFGKTEIKENRHL